MSKSGRTQSPVVSLPGSRRSSTAASQTPSNSEASTSSAPLDLASMIGAHLKLTLDAPISKSYEGLLWCYDPSTACVVLEQQPSASTPTSSNSATARKKRDYKIVKVAQVKSIEMLASPSPEALASLAAVTPVSLERVARNEEAAIKVDVERQRRLGKGVSKLAQEIFDALSKTLPTEWSGTSITVLEEITIKEPYDAQDCISKSGAKDSASKARLERVKKVLQGERARILRANPDLDRGG